MKIPTLGHAISPQYYPTQTHSQKLTNSEQRYRPKFLYEPRLLYDAHACAVAEPSMEPAKDLLKRAVELDSAGKHPEALICYEEGIQNLLRAMGGENNNKL